MSPAVGAYRGPHTPRRGPNVPENSRLHGLNTMLAETAGNSQFFQTPLMATLRFHRNRHSNTLFQG